jgi:hypothetical protein
MEVLPLRYQPSEPVENIFTGATIGSPSIVIETGFADALNCLRVTGQLVFLAIRDFLHVSASQLADGGIYLCGMIL